MKNVFIYLTLLLSSILTAHEQNVHRYIVSQAWTLLTYQRPECSNSIMANWIGNVGNTTYLTSVIAGAHNEDQQDIIWMNCGFNLEMFHIEIVPCVRTTINHFWNADNGDSDPVTILGSDPNALEKAKNMWYGTHSFLCGVSFADYGIVDKVDHNSLTDLHNNGNVTWLGYWNTLGQYFSRNITQQYSLEYRRRVSYSILGRICHLLADMSVPAHVHNDAHSPVSEEGTDSFEQWAKNNYSSFTWQDALAQGGTLFDVTEKEYPIRYLMYVVNQYADFFPSEGDWSGTYYGDRNYSTSFGLDSYPVLNTIFSQLGNPPTNINHSVQAEHLIPFAIRATASLLYLFGVEAGLFPPPPSPELSVVPITTNVGSGTAGTYFNGSFNLINTGNVSLSLTVQSPIWGVDLEGQNPAHIVTVFLMPGWSTTINYTGSFGMHDYGPFTQTITIDDNSNNIHATHSIIGTRLLPDFCFAETQAVPSSPEEQLFDKAFIDYFSLNDGSLDTGKDKSIKDRLDFAYNLLKKDKKEKIEDICKIIIELYPESEMGISFYIMGLLWEAAYSDEAPDFTEKEFKKYLKKIKDKDKYKINGYAQLILSLLDVGKDIDGLEKLFADYEYDILKELSLFHQFIHFHVYKSDKETARKISDKLDEIFIDSKYGYQAHLMLGDEGYTIEGLEELYKKKLESSLPKLGEIKTELSSEMPDEYKLFNNYPNPFNPRTNIRYSVPHVSSVKLSVYNMMGQLIKILVNERKAPGFYTVEWNGTNENNSNVVSGIYFYRLESDNYISNNKMILLR